MQISLKLDQRPNEKPLNYHSRTGHMLDTSKIKTSYQLQQIKQFAESNEMRINSFKTKITVFNKSLKYDVMPEINTFSEDNLEVVEEYKILGLVISANMKWSSHTKYICKRGYIQLWTLRRLKKLGANINILLDLYNKQVRSIVEYAAPAWQSMLTEENKADIERVQKCAFSIIFGPKSYEKTLKNENIKSLEDRRVDLTNKFANKCSKSPHFSTWFTKKQQIVNTRNPKIYKEVPARCNRWMTSPIPYMTRSLNN